MKNAKQIFFGLFGVLFPFSIYIGANYTTHFTSNLIINVSAGVICGVIGMSSFMLSSMYFADKEAAGEDDAMRNATTLLLKKPSLIKYVKDKKIATYKNTPFAPVFISLLDTIRQRPDLTKDAEILQYLKDTHSYYFDKIYSRSNYPVPFAKTEGQIVLEFCWIVR